MYDLILVGPSRAGTTTLWNCLGKHPEISPSLVKEPLTDFQDADGYSDTYFEKYYTTVKATKYLLDGCPLDTFIDIEATLKSLQRVKVIKNIKYITLLRDLHKRAFSHANLLLMNHLQHRILHKPPFLEEGDKLNEDKFIKWMIEAIKKPYINLAVLEDSYIPRECILVAHLNNLNVVFPKILKFLEIEETKLTIGIYNSLASIPWTLDYLILKDKVNKIFMDNYIIFEHLSEKYLQRIKNEYEVVG